MLNQLAVEGGGLRRNRDAFGVEIFGRRCDASQQPFIKRAIRRGGKRRPLREGTRWFDGIRYVYNFFQIRHAGDGDRVALNRAQNFPIVDSVTRPRNMRADARVQQDWGNLLRWGDKEFVFQSVLDEFRGLPASRDVVHDGSDASLVGRVSVAARQTLRRSRNTEHVPVA